MTIRSLLLVFVVGSGLGFQAAASVLTVTTTNNVSPASGQMSLLQALQQAKDGDEIQFKILGTGPFYLQTPDGGYPLITASNLFINGYSQPGSAPNANPILGTNNAKIQIVLDSRPGGFTPVNVPLTNPTDDPSFDPNSNGAVLAFVKAHGVRVQGLAFLGPAQVGPEGNVALTFVAFAEGASGQVSGCWLGVDPDGHTVAGAAEGIMGLRYRQRDATGSTTNTLLVDNLWIGVAPNATNAVQQFNVLAGMTVNPILVEGDNTRISGNFITVLPDGVHDVDVALDSSLSGQFRGAIQIGRGCNNTLIGTDGDGVNDANERNVMGGMVPTALGGYDHLIEFYGQNPGTNIVIAGNYIGVGIDGTTFFTNGVPALNGSGASAQYRIGSDFNGVSDTLEGNLIVNNWPPSLFPASSFQDQGENLSFFSQLNPGAAISLRGNSLINNFPFPASPLREGGAFLASYYAGALLDPSTGVSPVLSTNSNHLQIAGTVPLPNPDLYSTTIVDVYLADRVGITNGQAANIPGLPQGFVQGRIYLGSFIEGSAADLDPAPGAFKFDISKLNVQAGSQLTVTANYLAPTGGSSGGSTGDAPSFTSITRLGDGTISLAWDFGTLQSAPTLQGPWNDEVTTGNSLNLQPTDPVKFFRLSSEGGTPTGAGGLPMTSPFSNVVPAS